MKSYTASTPVSPVKWALMALISLIFLNSSCSDPSRIGIELSPDNNQIGVFYREFALDAQMILLDSFNTTNSTILLAGHEQDDLFGVTEATAFSRMFLDVTEDRPRNDAILDSTFFSLDVVSVNGSNLDQPKKYSVHQLTEPILDTLYYNFDRLDYQTTPFAEVEATFGEVKDTTLVFPVDETFAGDFFVRLRNSREFQTLFEFRDYFPGFALQAREGDNTSIGVALGGNTSLTFYFHYAGDTTATAFSITTFSSRSFNGVKSDRSGTPSQVIVDRGKTYDVGPIVGMKSGLAMALKVDTSPIDAFLDTLSGVTFNQINLNIGPIEAQDEDNNPISAMVMKFIDSENRILLSSLPAKNELHVQGDGQPQVIEDENGNMVPNNFFASAAVLQYDSENKEYRTRITSHVNAIFRGQLQRQDWLLFAETPTQGIEFRRSMRQYKINKDKIKVQVIYSRTR
ncbi:DUF4270 family protein [Algoriphagus sp. oki45]|uniref:DUF4270 family protein n=1 Tax=Algoriphagus sp. oki45 TaxID=3067294 RepID=UPI0030C6CD4B